MLPSTSNDPILFPRQNSSISDDETEDTNMTSTHGQADEDSDDDYGISDEEFVPTLNSATPGASSIVKEEDSSAFDQNTFDQSSLGDLLGLNLDPSFFQPEQVPDFGPAELTAGARGGAVLIYNSVKYPGKQFLFKIYGQSTSQKRYFACKGCWDMKRLYELKEKLPIVIVKNGRVVEIDPDNPKEEHFCMRQGEYGVEEGQNSVLPKIYGPVTFEEGKRNAKILVYESKKYDGHKFRFRAAQAAVKGKFQKFMCDDCRKIKNKLGVSHEVPKIVVKAGQIVGTDPDEPEDEHFCVPGMPNYPEACETMDIGEKEEIELVERGPAVFIEGARGGQLLVYDSVRIPGHRFTFRKSSQPWKGITTFWCNDCNKLKSRYGLSHEVPRVKTRGDIIVGDDPDYSSINHFCHPELPDYPEDAKNSTLPGAGGVDDSLSAVSEDWSIDYGEAKITQGIRGGLICMYESLLYPGHQLKFRKHGMFNADDTERFTCIGCMNVSRKFGLTHQLPAICVKNGRIIGRDPDRPRTEHYCIPGTANCPLSENDTHNATQASIDPDSTQDKVEFDESKVYGDVKFVKGRMGGHILIYESVKYPGHTFKFRFVPNSQSSYHCITCRKLKMSRGLDYRLPTIKVKDGKIIGWDPDSPPHEHFCLPQCEKYPLKEGETLGFRNDEEDIDRGPAKFIQGSRMGVVLVYESLKYPGHVFKWRKSSGTSATGATHYGCTKCMSIKSRKGLTQAIPYIRVRNGRIVGQDPDQPKNDHLCMVDEHKEGGADQSINSSAYHLADNEEELKDYGPAKFYTGRLGGENVILESQRFPGHVFKFVKTSNVMADGSRTYICLPCKKLKKNYNLSNKIPMIRVKARHFVVADPERPPNDHFCHPSCDGYPPEAQYAAEGQEKLDGSFDDSKNYGAAKFVETVRGGKVIMYDSLRYPGNQFRFNTNGGRSWKCVKCSRIKNNLGLNYRLPCIRVVNNQILGRDPDFPDTEHFCIEGTTNYPFYGKEDPFKEKPLKPMAKKPSDYGRAKIVDDSDQNSNIVYDSVEFPGHKFEFTRVGENGEKGTLFYVCKGCKDVKKKKKLSEKIPYIKVIRGRIVEWNPDMPKTPHFCVDQSLRIPPEFQSPTVVVEPIVEFENIQARPNPMNVQIKQEPSTFDGEHEAVTSSYTPEPSAKRPRLAENRPASSSCSTYASATVKIEEGAELFQNGRIDTSMPPPEPITFNTLDLPVLNSSSLQMTVLQSPASSHNGLSNGTKHRRSVFEASASELLLTEYSFLTKKVRIQSDEWTKHDDKEIVPIADVPIPAKKHVELNALQNSRSLDLSKFTLKEKFDNLSTVFSMDSSVDTLLLTDSLLQSLDETVLKKVAVVRAEFPIMPKWLGPLISSIGFSDKENPRIIYAFGYDWLVYFNQNPPKAIANLVKNEVIDILNSLSPTLGSLEGKLHFVFITIPEMGSYQLRFQAFNTEIQRHVKEIAGRFPKVNLEVLDWAGMIKNSVYENIKTVDRRLRMLVENSLDA